MPLILTSASGVNGNGFGTLLASEWTVSYVAHLLMTSVQAGEFPRLNQLKKQEL